MKPKLPDWPSWDGQCSHPNCKVKVRPGFTTCVSHSVVQFIDFELMGMDPAKREEIF